MWNLSLDGLLAILESAPGVGAGVAIAAILRLALPPMLMAVAMIIAVLSRNDARAERALRAFGCLARRRRR